MFVLCVSDSAGCGNVAGLEGRGTGVGGGGGCETARLLTTLIQFDGEGMR